MIYLSHYMTGEIEYPTKEEEARFGVIEEDLSKFSRAYLLGFSDENEGNYDAVVVDFDDETPVSSYILGKAQELDFRINRLQQLQKEPIKTRKSTGRQRNKTEIKSSVQGRIIRQELIDSLKAELSIFKGETIKPIVLHRENNVITGYHIGGSSK